MINDLDTEPIVIMKMGEAIFAEISKSNLDSIATEKNPCIYEEEKLTRTECLLDKVYIKQLSMYISSTTYEYILFFDKIILKFRLTV